MQSKKTPFLLEKLYIVLLTKYDILTVMCFKFSVSISGMKCKASFIITPWRYTISIWRLLSDVRPSAGLRDRTYEHYILLQ